MLRITREMADRIAANVAGGKKSEMLAIEVAERTPIEDVNITVPSGVQPTFEKEHGLTVRQVLGHWSTEHILRKSLEKIRCGEYRLTSTLAKEIGTSTAGVFGLGEWAALLFILDCEQSSDVETQRWALSEKPAAVSRLGLTAQQAAKLTMGDIKQRLMVPKPEPVADSPFPEKSRDAQGQTRKPGSHGESRHR